MTEVHIILLVAAAVFSCGFLAVIWYEPVRGLYVAIFASAILITPHLPVVREKVSACEVVIVLTWASLLATWPGRSRQVPKLLPVQKQAIAWGAGLILACGASFAVALVREDVSPIPGFVETVNYIYGFLLFLTVVHFVTSTESWVKCCYAWAAGTALACSVGLYSLATGGPDWTRDEFTGRLSATFKLANQLPSYCLPILSFVLVAAGWKSTRPSVSVLLFGLAGAVVANVLGTGSRIAFGMLCLMLTSVFWLALRGADRTLFRSTLFRWMGVGVVLGFGWFVASIALQDDLTYRLGYTPAIERPIRMWVSAVRNPNTELADYGGTRTDEVGTAIANLPERPLFGTGPHNFTTIFGMNEVHNTYIGVLAEEGIIGFIALMGFLVGCAYCGCYGLRRSRHSTQYLTILSVCIGFATLLFYGVAMFGLRQRPLWIMCGLMVALPRVLYSDHLAAMRLAIRQRPQTAEPATQPVEQI